MNNPLNAIWSSLSSAAKWTAGRVSQPGIARNAAIGTGIVAGAGIAGGVGGAYKNWSIGGNQDKARSARIGATLGVLGAGSVLGVRALAKRV